MYKVERMSSKTPESFYEVMLSPFKTLEETLEYINKYKQYYPIEDRIYKITETQNI